MHHHDIPLFQKRTLPSSHATSSIVREEALRDVKCTRNIARQLEKEREVVCCLAPHIERTPWSDGCCCAARRGCICILPPFSTWEDGGALPQRRPVGVYCQVWQTELVCGTPQVV